MLNTGRIAILAIVGVLAFNPAYAEEKSAAMVNGVSIPQSRIDLHVKSATSQGQPDTPDLRKAAREDMINREVITQEAVKMGLDKNPEVVQQTEMAKQSVLVGAFVQDYLKNHPVTDEQLNAEYEKYVSKLGTKEYKVSHILVDSEAEAKDIIAQLNKKAKFDKLAKEKSKDAGSAAHGGSLDWIVPGALVQPFADAMLKLKKGQYTKEPVQTPFGWHVIKLDDVRSLKVPTFEDLKPQIQQRFQQQAIQNAIADLRAKAKIE